MSVVNVITVVIVCVGFRLYCKHSRCSSFDNDPNSNYFVDSPSQLIVTLTLHVNDH